MRPSTARAQWSTSSTSRAITRGSRRSPKASTSVAAVEDVAPKGQLLLIDASSTHRLMMGNGLRASAWTVMESSSGTEALRLLRRETFDVVICDLKLPDMDGMAVLGKIRETDGTLPVVMTIDKEDD